MNVKLRKRHRYIWMVLGIALPLLCLEAIESIPKNPIADVPRHICVLEMGVCGIDTPEEFPIVIEQVKSKTQFGIDLKAPLKSAFTLVYLSKKQEVDKEAVLLGAIHNMGHYDFKLPENASEFNYVLLTDKIKNTTLFHQEFIKP